MPSEKAKQFVQDRITTHKVRCTGCLHFSSYVWSTSCCFSELGGWVVFSYGCASFTFPIFRVHVMCVSLCWGWAAGGGVQVRAQRPHLRPHAA